jgi:hypothetical protein
VKPAGKIKTQAEMAAEAIQNQNVVDSLVESLDFKGVKTWHEIHMMRMHILVKSSLISKTFY